MNSAVNPEETVSRRRPLSMIIALGGSVAIAGFSFLASYNGFWDPTALFEKDKKEGEIAEAKLSFVDVPQVVVSLAGSRPRTLILSVKIEAQSVQVDHIRYLLPRISDSFNGFLSEIDPSAFEKRGILDVVRGELATRLSYVLGDGSFEDVLITEFRIQ